MEYIVPILILFILLNIFLKLSFRPWWYSVVFSLVAALFLLLVVPFAASQSKTQLEAWLQNPLVMQNVAVLITVETAILFAFAFIRLRQVLGTPVKKYILLPLDIYPGFLLFPVLFYTLTQLFFVLPGVDFDTSAYMFAAGILVGIPFFSWSMVRIVPEEELRLEILFIVNLFVGITGLITTVNGETAYAAVNQSFDVRAVLLALAIFALLFAGGFLRERYRKLKVK